MKKSSYISANNGRASLSESSGYFKLDLPTGKAKIRTGETPMCQCGRSSNKPFCDGSHAKCVDGIVCPWF